MECPECGTLMVKRDGRFGPFLFCPGQAVCGQKTITVHSQPVQSAPVVRNTDLELEFKALWADAPDMARMAFENDREHEITHDHGSVDPWDVVFGGGPFVDGPYEDDEDAILW